MSQNMSTKRVILDQLFHRGKDISDFLTFNRARAVKWQDKTFRKLLYAARKTEFGKKYGFEEILISQNPYQEFANRVPISSYSSMHDWWQKEFKGETDVTWPGVPKFFALSSGTTEGSSKYIPISEAGLKSFFRASRRQLFAIFKTDVPKDFFTKDYLMVSGCTNLNFNGINHSGDLSGITASNVPSWFGRFAIPGPEITGESNWNKKIEMMVQHAPEWDVVMIAGAPAWVKMLLEKIIERYSLKKIHDIWPNFSVFAWGAVSIIPYKTQIDAMMGQPIKYFESYMASEGFIAFQTRPDAEGMRLVFKNKTLYEFVPFDENHFGPDGDLLTTARALSLSEVEPDKDYAILITTCSGAWRYLIGDTIRFVNVDTCEIKISGRTKQFLSICGEHLSVDNMNHGVELVAQSMGLAFPEFTVKGIKHDGVMGHQWYIACDEEVDAETVRQKLDEKLGELNDDYAVERQHVLKEMKLVIYPESVFLAWMEKRGKYGGQSKFPRVLPDVLYQDWLQYLSEINSQAPA